MDPLMLLFLLIAGRTGADSVSTVGWVTVQRGGSVTIPCFYDERYKAHVKSWCKGSYWKPCTPLVHTDSRQEGNVSIRDDPDQRVFTVTMNNLTAGDSGWYSCFVNISGASDVGDRVYLSVTEGVSTLRQVSVQRGGTVTIPCFYDVGYKTHMKYWCRGNKSDSCTPIVDTDSPQEGKVSVRDNPDQRVFTVTINNLTAGDSDKYWCRVKISGGSDVEGRVNLSVTDGPPGLSVDKQEVTGLEGDSVSVLCRYGNNRHRMWCKIGGSCASERSGSLDGRPVLIRDDRVNRVFSVTVRGLERKDTGWYWCDNGYLQIPVDITVKQGGDNEKLSSLVQLVLYVGLGLLVLLLVIIIITWKVWDKHKKNVAGGQNVGRTARKDGRSFGRSDLRRCMKTLFRSWVLTSQLHKVSSCGRFFFAEGDSSRLNPDPEYAVIDRTGISEGDPPGQTSMEPGADVTYSSIVLPEVSSGCSSHCPAVNPASDVVYSSVTLKHREGAATEALLYMWGAAAQDERDTQILQ
ncbi:polymeric immunoglobulin receptor-like isoform X3 [Brienomyrus brachyistius]|uniref:polymeric immunoglobulin receptor-like isoform X3 n=1 Tax=Brienomyrus brachyistius TaxID=42636 RepID=UPI0020B43A1B|nr:polymeric immunoglobulin receptor-like isoform X3 [Brienomyrus brachyistius]